LKIVVTISKRESFYQAKNQVTPLDIKHQALYPVYKKDGQK